MAGQHADARAKASPVFEVERGELVDFRDGAERIAARDWLPLAEVKRRTEAAGYKAKR